MTCKYFRKRKKDNKKEKRIYYYCSKNRKEINYCECKNYPYKEYKETNPFRKRTYKLAKVEKNRYSKFIVLSKCCVCGSKIGVQMNEIYEGKAYRQASIKYGMTAPLCDKETCHKRFHKDRLFALYYKALFQKEYEKTHSRTEFLKIFKKIIFIFMKRKRKCKLFTPVFTLKCIDISIVLLYYIDS